MSKKKKTLEDVQSAFAGLKTTLKTFGQELDSEIGITFDAEKSRVSLTKGQLVVKSMTAAAFVTHVEFLQTLSRESSSSQASLVTDLVTQVAQESDSVAEATN